MIIILSFVNIGNLKDVNVDGKIILKWILGKLGGGLDASGSG
jgi:hypothetical protein